MLSKPLNKRILILDDDVAVLDILQVLLDYEGFEGIIIQKTDDLFSLIRCYQPALMLLDFGLHGITGGEWCTQLKATTEFRAIPVIIFTAYSNKGFKKGSFGCDDFIPKPFDLEDLILRIRSLIGKESTFAHQPAVDAIQIKTAS